MLRIPPLTGGTSLSRRAGSEERQAREPALART